jgi:pimeloyl-ACP methyl ester carboxylesterase
MASFVLIPGAGGMAWYWHRVTPLLQTAGHEVIAVELPGDDSKAGLRAFADRVVEAIAARSNIVLVAQSLGGFTAPLVCERVAVKQLILNAMIPNPGESAGAWGEATGSSKARLKAARERGYSEEFEEATYFFHDVPPHILKEGAKHKREQSDTIWAEACAFKAWPDIPIHVIAGADDRLFAAEFQRRIAHERLGVEPDVLKGGHLIALANPRGLADRLISYLSSE